MVFPAYLWRMQTNWKKIQMHEEAHVWVLSPGSWHLFPTSNLCRWPDVSVGHYTAVEIASGQILVCPATGLSSFPSCWQWAAYATVSASPPTASRHCGVVRAETYNTKSTPKTPFETVFKIWLTFCFIPSLHLLLACSSSLSDHRCSTPPGDPWAPWTHHRESPHTCSCSTGWCLQGTRNTDFPHTSCSVLYFAQGSQPAECPPNTQQHRAQQSASQCFVFVVEAHQHSHDRELLFSFSVQLLFSGVQIFLLTSQDEGFLIQGESGDDTPSVVP